MNEDFNRLRTLFERALELTGPEREAYLDRECAGDPALRAEVARMLIQDEQPDAPREVSPGRAAETPPDVQPADSRPRGYHIKCPHCRGPIEVVAPGEPAEVI